MRYEIIDNQGVIHSGSEDEMREAFACMTGDVDYFDSEKEYEEALENYDTEWSGDLKLILVLDIAR